MKPIHHFLTLTLSRGSVWLWRILIFLVIILALIVSVGRELAPLVSAKKSFLEEYLSNTFGYVVQMEQVDARWEGLIPELHITELRVGSSVSVKKSLLRIDLLRSAIHQTLIFDALTIQNASIRIPVDAPLKNTTTNSNKAINLQAATGFLFGSANIHLQNVSILLLRTSGKQLPINVQQLSINNRFGKHEITGLIAIADAKQPIEINSHFSGSAKKLFSGKGRLFLDIGDGSKIRDVLEFARNERELPFALQQQGRLLGQFWLNWENSQFDWMASIDLKKLHIQPTNHLISYAGNLAGKILMPDGALNNLSEAQDIELSIHAPKGNITINGDSYKVPHWGLRYRSNELRFNQEPALAIYIPSVELAELSQYNKLLGIPTLKQTLADLQASGELKRLWLHVPIKNNSSFKPLLRANLNKVSVGAWKNAPALSQVDAYLEAGTSTGFIEVDSQHGFNMHFPKLYQQPMDYQQVQGRIYWNVDLEKGLVSVGSHQINLQGEDGSGAAAFWIDIPTKKTAQAPRMTLAVGIKNSHVRYRHKYLPNTLPNTLQQWLDKSIKEGELVDTGFIYRGSLRQGDKTGRSILYYGNLQNGELNFDPAWPELTKTNAHLLVDNSEVSAEVSSAQLNQLTLKTTQITVKNGQFLNIQGDVQGAGNSALDFLRKTPLRKTLGSTFDDWSLQNDIRARITLGISLTPQKEKDFQEVAIKLKNNNLSLQNINLSIENLTGDLHYSNTLGLLAPKLSANLWGNPYQISISPLEDQDALPDIAIHLQGAASPTRLATWSNLALLNFLEGDIPIEGTIVIPLDTSKLNTANSNQDEPQETPFAHLSFFSDLNGVALSLPAPFKKESNTQLPFNLNVQLFKHKQRYQIQAGSLISGFIDIPSNTSLKGLISLNPNQSDETFTLPDTGLRIQGNIKHAQMDDWLKIIERYAGFTEGAEKTPPSKPSISPEFKLFFERLQLNDLPLDNTTLSINYQAEHTQQNLPDATSLNHFWNIGFSHAAANGSYRYFDDRSRLPELIFEHLDLDVLASQVSGQEKQNSVTAEPETKDPLINVIPQKLPALITSAKQVVLNQSSLGAWNFRIQPESWGATLHDFSITMPGLHLGGLTKNQGAQILWRYKKDDENNDAMMQTQISSRIQLGKKHDLKNLFGIEPIIEADSTTLQGSLTWEGSPANIQFMSLTGELSLKSKKGRFLNGNTSTDLMRIINIINFNTWARRLKLDFSDLYKKGVSYDRLDGHVLLDHGKVVFDQPLVMDSPSSRFTFKGTADSSANTIDADLVVTLPVSSNATWIAAAAAGLPAAVGVWAVSKIFKKEIDEFASVSYSISGDLDDPKIKLSKTKTSDN